MIEKGIELRAMHGYCDPEGPDNSLSM